MQPLINARIRAHWERASNRWLVCFVAPGGFGKTTAAEWWASSLCRPVVRMDCEFHPNWRNIPAFFEALATSICQDHASGAPTAEWGVKDLRRLLQVELGSPITILLDDYHLIQHSDLDAALSDLCSQPHSGVSWLITSRVPLDWPAIPRLAARRQAVMITNTDLALNPDETVQALGLADDLNRQAFDLTEGWFFAINLLQDMTNSGGLPKSLASNDLAVAYVLDDVLRQYPPELMAFMQRTAVMGEFSVRRCHDVGLEDAAALIARLTQLHLFVRETENGFAFHSLIRQALVDSMPDDLRRAWQRHVADVYFTQGLEACLPLFLAAEAWTGALKAIVWFAVTRWREDGQRQPVAEHWVSQIPSEHLSLDPWGMFADVVQRGNAMSISERRTLYRRIRTGLAGVGDELGLDLLALFEARLDILDNAAAEFAHRLADIQAVAARYPENHPIRVLCCNLLLNYLGDVDIDRRGWEAQLACMMAYPPTTRLVRILQLIHLTNAVARYHLWGEFHTARVYWLRACEMMSSRTYGRSMLMGKQALLSLHTETPTRYGDADIAAVEAVDADEPYLGVFIAYHRAIRAWGTSDWPAVEAALHAVIHLSQEVDHVFLSETTTDAHLRLARLAIRRHDLDTAASHLRQGTSTNRTGTLTGDVAWHLAWLAHARRDDSEAKRQLQVAMNDDGQRLLYVRCLLLQSRSRPGTAISRGDRTHCRLGSTTGPRHQLHRPHGRS